MTRVRRATLVVLADEGALAAVWAVAEAAGGTVVI